MEKISRRPCIPLYEQEGQEAREKRNAGMTDFQVRFCALPFPVQNYVMLGFHLNNPLIKDEVKNRMKDERLEQLTAIQKEPELQAHLINFGEYMSQEVKKGKVKKS